MECVIAFSNETRLQRLVKARYERIDLLSRFDEGMGPSSPWNRDLVEKNRWWNRPDTIAEVDTFRFLNGCYRVVHKIDDYTTGFHLNILCCLDKFLTVIFIINHWTNDPKKSCI